MEYLYPAKLEKRVVNLLIDTLAILIIWFITGLLFVLTFRSMYPKEYLLNIFPFFYVPVWWLYYILLEYNFQKTVGKWVTKTRVVSTDGSKPSIGRIILRTFCRCIPLEYFSYFFTVNGIHDRLSKTCVVRF